MSINRTVFGHNDAYNYSDSCIRKCNFPVLSPYI